MKQTIDYRYRGDFYRNHITIKPCLFKQPENKLILQIIVV